MRNSRKLNPFFRIFMVLSVLILLAFISAIGLFYYIFAIPEPEGLSLASWPNTFTENFSYWIKHRDGSVTVTGSGIARLNAYGLWIQIIDESGQEVYSYEKPESYPIRYAVSELISIRTGAYEDGYTAFAGSFKNSGETWTYIIGFPYAIGKYMLYYNGEHIGRLSPVANAVVLLTLGALVLFVLGYGFWLSRQLDRITGSIKNVSLRAYKPCKESGTFSEIYAALNQMDIEVRRSDRLKEDTDRVRREWIANITHDLKTPLSPVKGFAELLADKKVSGMHSVQEYGSVILRNVNYMEKLINDLKLTYQLDSGTIPYHPDKVLLTRYVKELTIEIVNDPAFSGRNIAFESKAPELTIWADPDLLRRAIQNLVINALTHNPPDTKITIRVDSPLENSACIAVCDNGIGISEAEQRKLFGRYYRAASTGERPEGSGLGLAIAKQIVALHGGEITVISKPNEGSRFMVLLPENKQ